jgi:hypothetical protein
MARKTSTTSGTEFTISDDDSKLKGRCFKGENSVAVMFTFQDFSSHGNQDRFLDYQ